MLVGCCDDSVEMEEDQVPNKDSSQATGECKNVIWGNAEEVSPFKSYIVCGTQHAYMSS